MSEAGREVELSGANRWFADMTLGDATALRGESWACACAGRPPRCRFCWCDLRVGQAHELHRAAHIVAKLLVSAGACDGGHRFRQHPDTGLIQRVHADGTLHLPSLDPRCSASESH